MGLEFGVMSDFLNVKRERKGRSNPKCGARFRSQVITQDYLLGHVEGIRGRKFFASF